MERKSMLKPEPKLLCGYFLLLLNKQPDQLLFSELLFNYQGSYFIISDSLLKFY